MDFSVDIGFLDGWKTVITNGVILTASLIVILTPLAPFFTWVAVALAVVSAINIGLRFLTSTPIFTGKTTEEYTTPVSAEEVADALNDLADSLKTEDK